MNTPYTSDHLYHFVGWRTPQDDEENWKTLSLILDASCISHPPHDAGFGTTAYTIDLSKSLFSEDLIVPTVTCFADIPEGSLGWHVKKYGYFGVCFKRDFLIQQGARPVTYIPMVPNEWRNAINGKYLLNDIEQVYRGFCDLYDKRIPKTAGPVSRTMGQRPEKEEDVLRALKAILEKDFLAYIKPFDATLAPEDRRSYYMEREWRKFGNLCFAADDVSQVWVAPDYRERVQARFPALSSKVREMVAG